MPSWRLSRATRTTRSLTSTRSGTRSLSAEPVWRSFLPRVATLPGILLGVLLLVFVLVRLVPGGPAEAILGSSASAEQIAEVNRQLGLDRPLPVQFWDYLVRVASGEFGTSLRT